MENRQKNNDFEQLLKTHLNQKMAKTGNVSATQPCPNELELNDFIDGKLNPDKQTALFGHLASCPDCLRILELGQRAKLDRLTSPSAAMIARAKNIASYKGRGLIRDYKWPLLSGLSFILSYIISRYFVQFLVLAVIFSLKWITDTASTRTLIMVYQAWRSKDKDTAQRIVNDFHGKIGARK